MRNPQKEAIIAIQPVGEVQKERLDIMGSMRKLREQFRKVAVHQVSRNDENCRCSGLGPY